MSVGDKVGISEKVGERDGLEWSIARREHESGWCTELVLACPYKSKVLGIGPNWTVESIY